MSQRIKHVIIICSDLNFPGGIERSVVNTANLFHEKGFKVTLLIAGRTDNSFYKISPTITTVSIDIDFGITKKGNFLTKKYKFYTDIKRLKKVIESYNPDLIITTEYQFTVAVRIELKKMKVLSWEHHHYNHLKKSFFWNYLISKTYRGAHVICLNSEEAEYFKEQGSLTSVIPNFIEPQDIQSTLENKQLLTIGWLSYIKGVDLLESVARIVLSKRPNWQWKIIGSGESTNLKNIQNVILKQPHSSDLTNEYLSSSIYVMTSRMECFPMTLLEAMNHGLPCVSFNCPTGPKHIINNGKDGVLINREDVDSMAETIISLIDNLDLRKKLGDAAFKNIQRFSKERVYKLWEDVLN